MANKPYQRKGTKSNSAVGSAFELRIRAHFAKQGLQLEGPFKVAIGLTKKRLHKFDLGSKSLSTVVECKSHKWTESGNVPSAKLTTWNQEMYYFHLAPTRYRKILFVLRATCAKRRETLAEYYVRTHDHLIPSGVEVWEMNEKTGKARRVKIP